MPKELTLAGITKMTAANRYLAERFLLAYNRRFVVPADEAVTAFVRWVGPTITEILCVQEEWVVAKDNTVRYQGPEPADPLRPTPFHYVKDTVRVHE